jgi:HEAT repeat protein
MGEDGVDILLTVIEEGEARDACVEALGSSGSPRVFERLRELLDHPSRSTRRSAAVALGHLRDPRAVPHLARMLDAPAVEDDCDTRMNRDAVVRALQEITNEPWMHRPGR